MKLIRYSLITLIMFVGVSMAVETMKSGFVTYSEGDQGNRTLMYRPITNGQLGTPQKIVNKGTFGGDIQGVISFDGKLIAFARKNANPCAPRGGQWNGNGEDDYHKFHCWSIYVARLDQTFPTTPAKVIDEGYWPSWDENSTGDSKTLYYGVWTRGEVWKATVSSTGAVSNVVKHASVPGWASGDHHMQMAPNGKLLAIRYGGGVSVVGLNGFNHNVNIGGGCHPSWCSDSYWLYHANSWVGNINGGRANGWSGAYHWGSSYNMKWAITITNFANNAQNDGWPVNFASMQKTTSSLTIGSYDSPQVTAKGNFPDIHENEGPSISLKADATRISIGGSVKLTLSVTNSTTGTAQWSVSGGGTITTPTNTGATFVSNGTEGTFTIKATLGDLTSSATIMVVDPSKLHLKINCGGQAVNGWESDEAYALGGQSAQRPDLNASGTTIPEIYKTERYGMSGYRFDVPNADYTVKLYFTEAYEGITAAGQRVFNVGIEGKAITALDVYKESGGFAKALEKEMLCAVRDGSLDITFTEVTQSPMINGIEITNSGATVNKFIQIQSAPLFTNPLTVRAGTAGELRMNVQLNEAYTLEVFSADGRLVGRHTNNAPREFTLARNGGASGTCLVRLRTIQQHYLSKVFMQ